MKKLLVGLLSLASLSIYAGTQQDLYLEVESLAVRCQETDEICVNDLVLYGDQIRRVELVDNTGRVVLKENRSYYRTFTTNLNVTKLVGSYGKYAVNDTVLYGDSIRRIEALDMTGRIVLKETNSYYRKYTTVRNITKIVDSYDGYKAGDKVLYGNSIREVEAVDDTGRVILKENSNYYRRYTTNVSITMVEACR